jgi:hypothetical protein
MFNPVVHRAPKADPTALLFRVVRTGREPTHLLQSFVVDEACRILWDLELAFLDLLAKLPRSANE